MRCPPRILRNTSLTITVLLTSMALAACGNTCFAFFSNNGTGVIVVKSSSPPPSCSLSTGMGMMTVTALKSPVCESCTPASEATHIFVTVKSIQLQSVSPGSTSGPDWLELAPQLLLTPRQIDLLGEPAPEILMQNALIPAGSYHQLRLQFLPDAPASLDAPVAENSCGQNRRNCLVMADGHVEQLHFAAEPPQVVVPLQINGSDSLAVVPNSTTDLQLTLQPRQFSSISTSEGWHVQYLLAGSASVSR
jgi:hypothetical protein